MNPRRFVWLASAFYAAVYSLLDTDRYVTYHSGADLGLFTQTIASAFTGFSNTIEGGSHFTFHFSPILYLCAPWLWLARSAVALLVLQACAAALVAPALFEIAQRYVAGWTAAGVAGVALLYPPLAGLAFSDFHENAFAPAASAWIVWAVTSRRWGWGALFVALALCIKEDQAPILAFASLVAAVAFWRRSDAAGMRFSIVAFATCVAVFVGYFAVVRPLAGAAHAWEPLHFYLDAPPPNVGVGREVLGRFTYLLEAFVPLSLAPFASPIVLLALPGFVELFASRDPVTYTMGQHYAAVWIGYVLAAFAFGVARLDARRPGLGARVVQVSAAFCLLNVVFLSPTHWSHYLGRRTAHDVALDRLIASLPADMEVGTHDEIFAHLGFDPHASIGLARSPQYALFDARATTSYWVERLEPRLHDPRGGYTPVSDDDGIVLYRRVASALRGCSPPQSPTCSAHARR